MLPEVKDIFKLKKNTNTIKLFAAHIQQLHSMFIEVLQMKLKTIITGL